MARRRARTVCTVPGCPTITDSGRCPAHRAEADRARGTTTQRGYGQQHRTRFRPGVLARDPLCVCTAQDHGHGAPCGQPSRHADHHPLSRRDLVDAGHDPDDPAHGRGLCHSCHSRETAAHQPGGWNA
ncbi:holin [Kitasatospora sp. NPDC058406]|uniref:holin n=1 Tax=Kitasatospora sp. NPDC058406 TaxID=3346483 RepID=UPI0036501632